MMKRPRDVTAARAASTMIVAAYCKDVNRRGDFPDIHL